MFTEQTDRGESMIYIDQTFTRPAANIAAEQVLLELAESGDGPDEVLRIWEPESNLVVLGRGGKVDDDVFLGECRGNQIPVIRRFSGGGTILSGPGCLMYTVILSLSELPILRDIAQCHRYISEKMKCAYLELGHEIELQGHSDLCVEGKKFSGNAMRIGRTHVIYHGTLLVDFDLELIPRYLKQPPRRPEYREDRGHLDFVTNLPVDRQQLAMSLCSVFGATEGEIRIDPDQLESLLTERYSNDAWNLRL